MSINPMHKAHAALDAAPNQSGQASGVVRQRSVAGRSAGCTVLAVVRRKAKVTAITDTGRERRK